MGVVLVKVPRGSATVILHTKVEGAKFHQRILGRRIINHPPNTEVALYTTCSDIEVECEGPSELEWFP